MRLTLRGRFAEYSEQSQGSHEIASYRRNDEFSIIFYIRIILGLFVLQNLALAETNTLQKKHKNSTDIGWVESRNPTEIDYYWLALNFTTELA